MKKTVRTYTKRSLSVLMACLMLITAWVFVTPVSAVTTTNYYYKVTAEVTDDMDNCYMNFYLYGKAANGKGAEAQITSTYWSDKNTDNTTYTLMESNSSSFPTYVRVTDRNGESYYVGRNTTIKFHLYVGSSTSNYQEISLTAANVTSSGCDSFSCSGNQLYWSTGYNVTAGKSNTFSVNFKAGDGSYPKCNSVVVDTSPSNVTIPKSGTATTNFKAHALDQYGVRIASTSSGYSSSASITTHTGVTIPKQDTTNDSDYWKPSVTNSAKMNGNTNSKTLTATVSFTFNGVTKTASKTFTITDPKYTYTFGKNGGTKLVDASGEEKTSYTTFYGNSADDAGETIPTDGYYAGYEFIGMYDSAKDPSLAATKPTTSTSGYTDYLKTSTNMNFTDKTYYAAWWAKNVKVTYLNNDGSVLKVSNYGKYGQPASVVGSGTPAGQNGANGENDPTKWINKTTNGTLINNGNPEYVYTPGTSHGSFTYQFVGWEIVDAKQYVLLDTSTGAQDQRDYGAIVGLRYGNDDAVLRGDTTFRAVYQIASSNPYTVKFYDGSANPTTQTLNYLDTATPPTGTKQNDATYTYTFKGWATQSNANDREYLYDADTGKFDDDRRHTLVTNFMVFDNANYVAVYEKKYIEYEVTFYYVGVGTNDDGATVYDQTNKEEVKHLHYDGLVQIPAPQSYTGGKLEGSAPAGVSYSNSTGYTYNFSAWSPTLSTGITEIAVSDLSGWTASNANLKTKSFKATYTPVAAVYDIYFVGPDTAEGEDGIQYAQYNDDNSLKTKVLNEGNSSFSHGSTAVSDTQTAAYNAVVKTYRDDNYEYTLKEGVSARWAPAFSSSATDNATYVAQYNEAQLYTVNYFDDTEANGGNLVYRALAPAGAAIPAYVGDVPTKEKDGYATEAGYTFRRWLDSEGTVQTLMPEGGINLYADYNYEDQYYDVWFLRSDAVDAETGEYTDVIKHLHQTYMTDMVLPTENERAKPDDNKFHYSFASWDETPAAKVTEDHVYIASYHKSYVYYDVLWMYLNGEKVDGKDFRVEKYIYGERVRAPFSTPEPNLDLLPPPETNKTYVFDEWVLAEKVSDTWQPVSGPVPFTSSLRVENLPAGFDPEAEPVYAFLPTYKQVADFRTLTILDEDDTVLGTQQIGYGETILDKVTSPDAKNPDATNHFIFDKWINVATNAAVTATDTMTDNITIKAVYRSEAHTYTFFDTVTAPTFDEGGTVTLVCEAEGCRHTMNVNLTALTDDVIPGIRLYVKNSLWDSTDPTTLTALDDTVIPVAPNSLLIANGTDSANVSTYYINKSTTAVKTALAADDDEADYIAVEFNTEEKGSGVNEIWAYYTEANANLTLAQLAAVSNATDSNPDGWHNIYQRTYNEETEEWSTEEANHSDVFASFEPAVVDGHQYVVYLKAVDAKGKVNYVSSAKVGYDTTAPEVALTSVAGGNDAGTKFCLDATIVLTEPGLTVTLDGKPITMVAKETTDPETNDPTTTYEFALDENTDVEGITVNGKHVVRVTDAAGNLTTQAFEIVGSHKTTETYKAATCTEPGWKKNVCTLCGNDIGEVQDYPAADHTYQVKTKRATCTEAGYTQEICSKCGDAKEQVAIPALGHEWNAGKITKQPNCTQNGTKVYTCTRCGVNDIINGDALDVTADGYDEAAAAAILLAHPDLQNLDEEENPIQATDAFGNPAYVQKTDAETGDPLFTETVATDADGKTIYNNDGSAAYLPEYDTEKPIYSYAIVHDYNNHNFKIDRQTKAATCTEEGEYTHECRFCGLKFHVRDVNALGHDWTADPNDDTQWTVGQAASCTEDGFKYPTVCARCGAENEEMEGQVELPKTGHQYTEDTENSVAPAKDADDHWITYTVFIGEYYVDDHGDMIDDANKIGEEKTVYGYKIYVCDHDPHHLKVVEDIPEVEYTYTFISDGLTLATLTKSPGGQIALDEVPEAAKAATNTTRYIFKEWLVQGTTDVAAFPMIITEETGNLTFVASFREEDVLYTISFYEEDGTTLYIDSGYKTYEQEFVQTGPQKASDATYDYTFEGWIPLDAAPDTAPITTIKVLGNASYKAVYSKAARSYSVAWVIDGNTVKVETVTAGTTLQALLDAHAADSATKNPEKAYDANYHYTFSRWDPALSTAVSGNMSVHALFQKTSHSFTPAGTTPATCTDAPKTTYRCDCGYSYEKASGKALGHNWVETGRQNPTATADGYVNYACSRCHDTKTDTLPATGMINLTITVKDNTGNPVSGANVRVYDGSTLVASGTTGGDGKVTVQVPEAKTYRIEIDGSGINSASGTITVDQNGRITGGAVPTVTRPSGYGCDCTCHKSGFWPMIFRFFHKIIKMITGEFRCCPDANY